MAAGVCLWTALLGLGGGDGRWTPGCCAASVGCSPPATLSVVLLAGLRDARSAVGGADPGVRRGPARAAAVARVARRHRGQVALAGALAVAISVSVLLWNRGNVPISPGARNGDIDTSWGQVVRWPNWILGSIGAFPYRDQPAPLAVHLLVLLVLLTMLVVAVRPGASRKGGRRRWRRRCASWCPSALVAVSLQGRGGMWQGRYDLPFTAGVMVLAGPGPRPGAMAFRRRATCVCRPWPC